MAKHYALIILDRDGVINYDSPEYIKSPDEWTPVSGSLEAIAKLNQAGYKVAVATNQSGIARGYYSEAMLKQIHEKMLDLLQQAGGHLDALFYCPHGPDDGCDCRKPKPGLLLQIGQYLQIDLHQALMIGDSARDIEAAHAAGAEGILVKPALIKNKATNEDITKRYPTLKIYKDLAEVTSMLLGNYSREIKRV